MGVVFILAATLDILSWQVIGAPASDVEHIDLVGVAHPANSLIMATGAKLFKLLDSFDFTTRVIGSSCGGWVCKMQTGPR